MVKIFSLTRKLLLLFLPAVLFFVSGAAAQDADKFDEIVQHYVSNENFMGSVLVARDKEILFNKGYGSANLEWNIPNSPTTKFRIGSITKQFTAASIFILEDMGKLRTDDPIKNYLPDIPSEWDEITIYNLLTNTSGIPNYSDFPEYMKEQLFFHTPQNIVDLFRDKPLEFKPGSQFSYSSSGFILLGCLIEKVSGESYEEFIKKNIFLPLGMKDSGYDSNAAVIEQRASGYHPGPEGLINAEYAHMSVPFSAGALYSTSEDLLRWEQGLFGGKMLSDKSLSKMITPFIGTHVCGYACGLELFSDKKERKIIKHEGAIQGFHNILSYYPDDKITIVVLSNVFNTVPPRLEPKLAGIAYGEEADAPKKEIRVPYTILLQYEGVYELAPGNDMTITLEGGYLMVQATGDYKYPLFAESKTKFFLKDADADLEFFKDETGKVSHFVLNHGVFEVKVKRKQQ